MDEQQKKLRAMLHEDIGTEDSELAQALQSLKQWNPPAPDDAATALLLGRLRAEMPPAHKPLWLRLGEWWPLLLIRSQVRVVRREIWAATLLIITLGTFVTLLTENSAKSDGSLLAVVSPLVAALGIAFLYDEDGERIVELENSTTTSIRLLLLARLTLIFGFNLLLGLIGSVVLAIFRADVLLVPLVMSWLAPMTFLCALAFLCSTLTHDALLGSLVGFLLWGTHIFLRMFPGRSFIVSLLSLPGFSAPENRLVLIGSAVLLVIVALWWGGAREVDARDWG